MEFEKHQAACHNFTFLWQSSRIRPMLDEQAVCENAAERMLRGMYSSLDFSSLFHIEIAHIYCLNIKKHPYILYYNK